MFQKPTATKHRIGPLVGAEPGHGLRAAVGLQRLEADQRQRHDFERREHRADGDHRGRRAGPVQVVQRAQDAAEQEHDGLRDDGAVGARGAHQAQAREDQRDDGGGEHFEEAFDPQVHQPPAPVLDHRVVGVLAPGERGGVEAADAGRRQEHHRDQAARLRRLLQRRPQGAAEQEDPEQQADEQQDLPDAAHAGELEALVAEPEAEVDAAVLQRAEPAGGGRADAR